MEGSRKQEVASEATLATDARILALQNAVKHKGVANAKALIGGMIGQHPELKARMGELHELLEVVTAEVNALSSDEQEAELRRHKPDFDKKVEPQGLKPLPNAEQGKVVLRFEPSPSGPLHIGHAYPFSLNLEYAAKYGGECHLRIADTNPENISPDAYDLIPEDARWLAERPLTPVIQSDRLPRYYDYALKLLEEGHAYVCTCPADEFKRLRDQGVACPCRTLPPDEHVARWRRMHDQPPEGYEQGAAVVRFKTDIAHKNPAMRDFPILRINDAEHPRQGRKYRVWPLMNFSVAIDDLDMGVTHTLRGKDHADNAKKQAFIHEALGHPTPTALSVGRINFDGFPVSCSKTRPRIEAGEFTGWDDPRIPFLPALRRRGYHPRALRQYAVEVGVTRNDKSVTLDEFFKHINALNKSLLDPVADRYFFIPDPVEITVEGAPSRELELDLHPDTKKGGRRFRVAKGYFLSGDDYERLAKDAQTVTGPFRVRFMENLTVEVTRQEKSGELRFRFLREAYEKSDKPRIHWLPSEEHEERLVKVTVVLPDGTRKHGLGEEGLASLEEGAVVQFERFGFCRLDERRNGRLVFYYAHR